MSTIRKLMLLSTYLNSGKLFCDQSYENRESVLFIIATVTNYPTLEIVNMFCCVALAYHEQANSLFFQ
jgi:hypothetical protein